MSTAFHMGKRERRCGAPPLLNLVASGASPVRRFASTGLVASGASPVRHFASTNPGGQWSITGEALGINWA